MKPGEAEVAVNRNGRTACTAQRKATVLLTVANAAPRPRRELHNRRQASKLSRATGAGEAGAKNKRAALDTRDLIDWNISDRKRRPRMPRTQRAPVHGVARRGKSDCCLCDTRVAFMCKSQATARTSGQKKHYAARKIGRTNQPSQSPARLDTDNQHNLMAEQRKPP